MEVGREGCRRGEAAICQYVGIDYRLAVTCVVVGVSRVAAGEIGSRIAEFAVGEAVFVALHVGHLAVGSVVGDFVDAETSSFHDALLAVDADIVAVCTSGSDEAVVTELKLRTPAGRIGDGSQQVVAEA